MLANTSRNGDAFSVNTNSVSTSINASCNINGSANMVGTFFLIKYLS